MIRRMVRCFRITENVLVSFLTGLALMASSLVHAGNVHWSVDKPSVDYPLSSSLDTSHHSLTSGRSIVIPEPGIRRAVMPPVTLEQARLDKPARILPVDLLDAATGFSDSSTRLVNYPLGPASVPELARALRHNVDLIYQFIRNNTEYYPVWGVQKGAVGTIIDNQGTAFDQAILMVELLRASGYTANYVRGVVRLSAAQLQSWYGYDTSQVCAVLNLLGQAQIPIADINATSAGSCPGLNAALLSVAIEHVWVQVDIDGVKYAFDPSHKPHSVKQGVDVQAAAGYDPAAFFARARLNATVTNDFVYNINRVNIHADLESSATRLADWLRVNKPAATLDDVIGGKTIVPMLGNALRQTDLPYRDAGYETAVSTSIAPAFKPTVRIVYQGIDKTFTSDAIYGRRLTVTYDSVNVPVLKLDGVTIATGTSAVAPGAPSTISFVVWHNAYSSAFADHVFSQNLIGGGTYVIGNAWGPTGRGLAQRYLTALNEHMTTGMASSAEPVLGSSLSVLAAQWMGQNTQAGHIAASFGKTELLHHHQVGIAGYTNSSYVDLPSNIVSVVSSALNANQESATFANWGMHLSVLESTTVKQTTGVEAVSTVSLIDKAAADGLRIYNATTSNFSSVVKPNLLNCNGYLADFQHEVDAGRRVIVPQRCDLTVKDWTGVGYYTVGPGLYLGAIISGGLSGGFSAQPLPAPQTNSNIRFNTTARGYGQDQYAGKGVFNDPIDMVNGNYLYENNDITTGIGDFPYSLSLNRLYSSGLSTQDGTLGRGWAHDLDMSARVSSDGFLGMGQYTALDAVHAVVEILSTHHLLLDSSRPTDKMVMASLSQRWFGERVTNNTVVVRRGLNGQVFVKLPQGFYNPPPGKPIRLTRQSDGGFHYGELHHGKYVFNSAGQVVSYDDPSGMQVRYSYTGDQLSKVENSLGRMLSMTYAGTRLVQVGDGSRSVSYAYDTAGNLTTYRDALNQATAYRYDVPGRMTQLMYPSFPTVAAVTNTYDSLGRVQTQANAAGKLYTYYFAGFRSEELGPGNTSRAHYLDWQGNTLQQSDPLGRWVVSEYDGLSRLKARTQPEANGVSYSYDDASCFGPEKRCTGNISEIQYHPKPGSSESVLTQRFTYDPVSNKVATATDARGSVTRTTYNSQLQPQSITEPANSEGVSPVSTHAYTGFLRAGWNTFYLPTSVTVKTTADASTTTSTSYSVNNYYAPHISVVDSGVGKLNLNTTFAYDPVGNLVSVDGPRTDISDVTLYQYDAQRRLTVMTNAAGLETHYGYDPDGRPTGQSRKMGTQWFTNCTQYLPTGKPSQKWGPALASSILSCPATTVQVPLTTFSYDDLDREHIVTEFLPPQEGGNRVTETLYYADNRVQRVKKAVGTVMAQDYATYYYTPNGKLNGVKGAKDFLTVYLYDGHDRLFRTHYPLPSATNTGNTDDYEQFGYDANGNVIQHRKRNGLIVTQSWDRLNRLVARNYPDAARNLQFSYDLRGLRTQALFANNSFATTYAWDNAGRMVNTVSGGQSVSSAYDAAGNRTRLTWPDGYFISTSYDVLNRPSSIKENGLHSLAVYTYDDLSRRANVALGNGTNTQYEYNAQGFLAKLLHDLAGTAHDIGYAYVYNRAVDLIHTNWTNRIYSWEASADWKTYASNGLNQYTAVSGAAFSYDANGNLTGDGAWTYGYDTDNRLISAGKAGLSAAFSYDAPGRLRQTAMGSVQTRLLYDDMDLIAEYDGAGVMQKRYVHGPGIDEPLVVYEGSGTAAKSWLYANHQGSIIARANTSGASEGAYSYGPFGEPSAPADTLRWRYTGQQYVPALGLSYYKARWYSPTLGRFLQTDPAGYQEDLNLYAYVGNSPVTKVDPSGEVPVPVVAFAIGAGMDAAIQFILNGSVDWTQAGLSGGAAVITGNIGAGLQQAAYRGAISSGAAVGYTGLAGGAASASASAANDMLKGQSPDVINMALFGLGGAVGAAGGSYITNATSRSLEQMKNSTSNLLSGIADTTRSAVFGGVQAPVTAGQTAGSRGAEFGASYGSGWMQNQLRGARK